MTIKKSPGTTPTEQLLADLCEKTFLGLWSYPNPFKEDGKELCDLVAVFNDEVFVFFDRKNRQYDKQTEDAGVAWNRWKSRTVDKQVHTAHGAESYLRRGGAVFLDPKLSAPLPIDFDCTTATIHKIVIAHGAEAACKAFASENTSGSLAVSYTDTPTDSPFPFCIFLDRSRPVHVLDGGTLPILLTELDTFFDLAAYLNEKTRAIQSLDLLAYCGEEDLLAHYLCNYDKDKNQHFIGVPGANATGVMISEGEWLTFKTREEYRQKKVADRDSAVWDDIIQRTCENEFNETLLGDSILEKGGSAVHEMAKEPRFVRRALSSHILRVIREFPEAPQQHARHVLLLPSFYSGTAYVFLQLKVDEAAGEEAEQNRNLRRHLLEVACGAAKNLKPELQIVVGIAIYAPKYSKINSEDLARLDCQEWTDEQRAHYDKLNKELKFFAQDSRRDLQLHATEFPTPSGPNTQPRPGRNDPCPCGSKKKYKRCCIKNK